MRKLSLLSRRRKVAVFRLFENEGPFFPLTASVVLPRAAADELNHGHRLPVEPSRTWIKFLVYASPKFVTRGSSDPGFRVLKLLLARLGPGSRVSREAGKRYTYGIIRSLQHRAPVLEYEHLEGDQVRQLV
jgi:hypothetical protein